MRQLLPLGDRPHRDRPLGDGRPATLPYLPGIDGLRAISVIAVLLYHADVSWMPGGFLGVEVFFVISGFLITALLLAERRDTGTVHVGRFWLRRARRLLPALFVMLGVSMAFAVLFLRDELAGLRGDALASLGYVTNWYLIFSDQSYFESFGRPSLYQHLWSLAVEEQFYLFWPLAFAGGMKLLGRRRLLWGVVAGVAASAALMWVLFDPGQDPSRIYYGADTRAAGLFVGVALAFVWHPNRLRRATGAHAPIILDVIGGAALLLLVRQFMVVSEFDASLYQGGFLRLSLLTAAVLAVVAHPAARLGRLLGLQPLLWVGLRSYSIYLWHWPVFMVTRPDQDVAIDGLPLLALRFGLTFALAALSYRFVEVPVRQGALQRRWAALRAEGDGRRLASRWALAGGGFALLALLVGGVVIAAEPPAEPSFVVEATGPGPGPADPGPTESALTLSPLTESLAAATGPTSDAAPDPETAPPTTEAPAPTEATASPPAPAAPPGPVLAVGDSVMLGAAPALQEKFGDRIVVDAQVSRSFEEGIWSVQYHDQFGVLPDTVVIHLGNNDAYFTDDQFDKMMRALEGTSHVLFLTVKVNQRYQDEVNTRLAAGVERWPNASLADWKGISETQADVFAPDLTHLNPPGATLYADFVSAQVDG